MAYVFTPTEDTRIMRSRYTGEWVLQEKNKAYGYFATIACYHERLSLEVVADIATKLDIDYTQLVAHIEDTVRKGTPGLRPRPYFDFCHDVTL